LPSNSPDETLESLTVSPDLEHSLSGNYARGLLRRGSASVALLAVPDGESADTADNSLTFALLWLTRARQANQRGTIAALRLILPKGAGRTIARRLAALEPHCPVELYERDPALETLEKIDPRRAANLDAWLVPRRESEALLDRARPALAEILALARAPRRRIRSRHPVKSGSVFAAFRLPAGLTAACLSASAMFARISTRAHAPL
jgi:hypothetical protein